MSMRVFRRMVEAFFRYWAIYSLVLAGAALLGILTVTRADDSYTSSGTIFVDNQSLVTAQSGVQSGGGFSYFSPAQFTSQEFQGLVQTDVFLAAVVERAGVELAATTSTDSEGETSPGAASFAAQASELRSSIGSYPLSENLLAVFVTTADPDMSYRLTVALIDQFVQFQIDQDVAESAASEEFFTDLASTYEQDVVTARTELDAALRQFDGGDEPTAKQELEIERLKAAETLAVERFQSAVQDVEVSRLAMLQTETDIRQSYSVFDPPQQPSQPDGGILDSLSILVVFTGLGLCLALVLPLIQAFVDRKVLFPEDFEGQPVVLSVVPKSELDQSASATPTAALRPATQNSQATAR